MKRSWLSLFVMVPLLAAAFAGCSVESYPSDKIKESLAEICRNEYGIEDIDVKIVGKTIGVYLPLKELFAADFAEMAVSGKVRNLETLFEPSMEAMDKIENVLFSISRVLLSTNRKLDFYILQATDTEKTGLQLILSGYVDDIKRVRIWDISRDEYRKRVIHELQLNHNARAEHPVRQFFQDLEVLTLEDVRKKYFQENISLDLIQSLFFNQIATQPLPGRPVRWEVLDLRSSSSEGHRVFVYVKVRPWWETEDKKSASSPVLEYIFMLTFVQNQPQLIRVVPFQYQDRTGQYKAIPFPPELKLAQSIDQWEPAFQVKDIQLGSFLAQQLTRRVQMLLSMDERIQNTFRDVKLNLSYHEAPPPAHFLLDLEASLQDFHHYPEHSVVFHEDMLYLLNLVSREFVEVIRDYRFGDFEHLALRVGQEPGALILGRENLELFRRKKLDIQDLLSTFLNF